MEASLAREIKRRTIKAVFSNSTLASVLALKGGNLLDVVLNILNRSSIDLDFSMCGEFPASEQSKIINILEYELKKEFKEMNLEVIDLRFEEKPSELDKDLRSFWGGYKVEFKLVEENVLEKYKDQIDQLRVRSLTLGKDNRKAFTIEISKHEFCERVTKIDLEGLIITIYSPEMVLFEKLRAICQQLPEYKEIVKSATQSARAKDFYDIHAILSNYAIDITSAENIELISNIFKQKKVPMDFILKISDYREYHRMDFVSLESTVEASTELKDFDFYFDFVIESVISKLESFWIE
jgi:predicted nucleotidyltransferase component of viral defense system